MQKNHEAPSYRGQWNGVKALSHLFFLSLSPQKVTYKTKRPLFDLRTIAEVEGAGVKAGKHAEWREQIIVPPLPQSALAGCSLIDIDYFIQVSAYVCLPVIMLTQ